MKLNQKIFFAAGRSRCVAAGLIFVLLILAGPACTGTGDSQDIIVPADYKYLMNKLTLWRGSTRLRGANIWLTRGYGIIFQGLIGTVPFGPAYTQDDFDQLAAMGANYVNISHPGLYAESSPYELDTDAQASLDSLLSMIANADMFAVISFRPDPGAASLPFSGMRLATGSAAASTLRGCRSRCSTPCIGVGGGCWSRSSARRADCCIEEGCVALSCGGTSGPA